MLIAIAVLSAVWSAPSAAAAPNGCRASGVRIGGGASGVFQPGFEPIVANPGFLPCVDDYHAALNARGRVGALQATTTALDAITDVAPLQAPSDFGTPDVLSADNLHFRTLAFARSEVDSVTITVGLNRITARGLRAGIKCVEEIDPSTGRPLANPPRLEFRSSVAAVTVNGDTFDAGDQPLEMEVAGVGRLHVNAIVGPEPLPHGGSTRRWNVRTLWLETLFGDDVVVAEGRMTGDPDVPFCE